MKFETTHEIIVTHMTRNKTCFAVCSTTGEAAHIAPTMVQRHNLSVGHVCQCILVSNIHDPNGRTPWRVAWIGEVKDVQTAPPVEPVQPVQPVQPVAPVQDQKPQPQPKKHPDNRQENLKAAHEALIFLKENCDNYFRTGEISEAVGLGSRRMSNVMEHLHALGHVYKAQVTNSPEQSRNSLTLWAANLGAFDTEKSA